MPMIRSIVCHHIVGHDARGGGVGCGKPRCADAGRRSLCLEHWRELNEAPRRKRRTPPPAHRKETTPMPIRADDHIATPIITTNSASLLPRLASSPRP
jgi:hypothetical protein